MSNSKNKLAPNHPLPLIMRKKEFISDSDLKKKQNSMYLGTWIWENKIFGHFEKKGGGGFSVLFRFAPTLQTIQFFWKKIKIKVASWRFESKLFRKGFWPRVHIVVLGMTFFFLRSHLVSIYFIWTFISLFYLDF